MRYGTVTLPDPIYRKLLQHYRRYDAILSAFNEVTDPGAIDRCIASLRAEERQITQLLDREAD